MMEVVDQHTKSCACNRVVDVHLQIQLKHTYIFNMCSGFVCAIILYLLACWINRTAAIDTVAISISYLH